MTLLGFIFSVIVLFMPHMCGHSVGEIAASDEPQTVFIIVAIPHEKHNDFQYSVLMSSESDDQAVRAAILDYPETMDFLKTLRQNEQEREKENRRK